MARIAGIDIPKNKHINIALRYIYGIGPALSLKILDKAKVDPEIIADALSEEQVNRIRDIIDHEFTVEGELRREITVNIKRLQEIGSYRGTRHRRNLPVRGQRTRTNARIRRGVRQTVAGRGRKRGATKK
ncbi:MAG: 30S ribosomal protein S13 [Dehalococcoidales bacterium]|nr:30S ribosomal protein S13 [Dehalococcoidales bacterium]